MEGFYPEVHIDPVNIWPSMLAQQNVLRTAQQARLTAAQVGLTGAQTVGQQIRNQIGGLTLENYGRLPPVGAPAPATAPTASAAPQGGPLPPAPTGRDLVTPGGAGGNALAPMRMAAAGGLAAAGQSAPDYQADAPPRLPAYAPGSSRDPITGYTMPYAAQMIARSKVTQGGGALDFSAGADWAVKLRNQRIFQSLTGATNPAQWRQHLLGLYREGYVDGQTVDNYWNEFGQRDALMRRFASPDANLSYQGQLAGQGYEEGPGGPVPSRALMAGRPPVRVQAEVQGRQGPSTVPEQIPQYEWTQRNLGRPGDPPGAAAPGAGTAAQTGAQDWARYQALSAQAESGGNPAAHTSIPGQTASGLYGFTAGTWQEFFPKAYPQMANLTPQQMLAMKANPEAQRAVFQAETAANAQSLEANHVPVNMSTLRLAHMLGPNMIPRMMGIRADTPLRTLVSPDTMRNNGWAPNETMGQLIEQVKGQFGLGPVSIPTPGAAPTGAAETGAPAGGPTARQLIFGNAAPAAPGAAGAAPAAAPSSPPAAPAEATAPFPAPVQQLLEGGTPVRVAPGPTGEAAAASAPPGTIVGAPVPAATTAANIELQQRQGQANIAQMQAMRTQLQTAADGAAQMNGIIDQMRVESTNWKPGAFQADKMRATYYLDAVGQALGFKPNQNVGSWQAFNKNAMQLTTQAVRATSAHAAVEEFNMIRGALPGDMTSPQAASQIFDELQGINDWRIAKSYYASHWQGPANQFDADWNSSVSLGSFILNRMSGADAATLAHNLSKTAAGRALWKKMYQETQMLGRAGILQHAGVQ